MGRRKARVARRQERGQQPEGVDRVEGPARVLLRAAPAAFSTPGERLGRVAPRVVGAVVRPARVREEAAAPEEQCLERIPPCCLP
jgi:hypothetical protein